jgi:regulatory protein
VSEARALSLAYAYLNRRERTTAELRAYLARKDLGEPAIDVALAELTELGYVDDARYARLFTQDKRTLEGWGGERIRRALRERGVERELVEHALSGDEAGGELARALELLRRRFPHPPADRRERDRALGMMIRKGYDGELALEALAAYARE